MPLRRTVPALLLGAALAACAGGDSDAGEAAEDVAVPTPASSGNTETGTVVNDTTPYRPGSTGVPGEVGDP